MKQKIVFFILQLLCGLSGGDDSVYADAALAESIGSYAEAEGIVSFLEKNSDVSEDAILRYLELRFSNLRAMSFRSAKYFLLHWEEIRMLWNEATLLRQKAPTLSVPQAAREKQRLQNLCAMLGCDNSSIQYASELVAYAFSIGK